MTSLCTVYTGPLKKQNSWHQPLQDHRTLVDAAECIVIDTVESRQQVEHSEYQSIAGSMSDRNLSMTISVKWYAD